MRQVIAAKSNSKSVEGTRSGRAKTGVSKSPAASIAARANKQARAMALSFQLAEALFSTRQAARAMPKPSASANPNPTKPLTTPICKTKFFGSEGAGSRLL